MAEPLARFEGFEGFEAASMAEPLARFEGGSFGPLEKKDLARQSPSPQSAQLRPQSRTEPRAHSLASARFWSVSNGQYPVWQNHWQGSRGLRGLARHSPEPTVCATPPTVSHRAQSPQSSKCEVWERLKRAQKSKDLESSGSTPSVVPGAAPAFAKAGVGGYITFKQSNIYTICIQCGPTSSSTP